MRGWGRQVVCVEGPWGKPQRSADPQSPRRPASDESRSVCLSVSLKPTEKAGPGGACHHPASPLDVTVVLCEQRWGALPGP